MGAMGDSKEKDKEKDCSTCLYVAYAHMCCSTCCFLNMWCFLCHLCVVPRDGSRDSVSGSGYSRIRVPMFSFHNAVILPPG